MGKSLDIYYFGDIGSYDEYNPAYLCKDKHVGELLYLIANSRPYAKSDEEIREILGIDSKTMEESIRSLKRVHMIDENNNCYKINFPVFLEKDLPLLDKSLGDIARAIGDTIVKMADMLYSKLMRLSCHKSFTRERLLYHIICDYIFDGTAMDFFGDRGVFCISKQQPGNRDYIAVGYEVGEAMESRSNKLLCSSNNIAGNGVVFNSFGDSNGYRKDMFRFLRLTYKALESTTNQQKLNDTYIKIIDGKNKTITEECGRLIRWIHTSAPCYFELIEAEKDLVDFLTELHYLDLNASTGQLSIRVPVFTKEDQLIIWEISTFLLDQILETVSRLFLEFGENARELTALQHHVDIKEVLNDLWHQVFGMTNEYLVEIGFVAAPPHMVGEGRYFQSLSIN